MAIIAKTDSPRALLAAVRKAIDDGNVVTWSYDKDGDFTHTPTQWANKAWLRPVVRENDLLLTILAPSGSAVSTPAYAIFHARFIEMLLSHFDGQFVWAYASALPKLGDIVRSP